MKFLIALALINTIPSYSQTGRNIQGPDTMGHPSYPNSGPLRNRSNDMTGEDMSSASHMGSDVDLSVPSENPTAGKKSKPETQTGPYRDSKIFHPEEGPDGIEAQEAVKDGSLELTEEEIKRKQKGN